MERGKEKSQRREKEGETQRQRQTELDDIGDIDIDDIDILIYIPQVKPYLAFFFLRSNFLLTQADMFHSFWLKN